MLLTVSNLGVQFGEEIILEGVSFGIKRGEKAALVGRNGTGKTTLIRSIIGDLDQDKGDIHLSRGAKIGLLRQEQTVPDGSTVLAEAEKAAEEKVHLRDRIEDLGRQIEQDNDPELLEEYAALQERFHEQEGWQLEADIRLVLQKVGFTEAEYSKPTDSLSGGEKTRLALAKLLLEEPDLLILDEPTNHLDLHAVEWLEGWLKRTSCAVLAVSHDETFLEAVAESIIEIREFGTKKWPGGWVKAQKLREEYDDRRRKEAAAQEEEIARLDAFVKEFIDSQRTAQARGRRIKMNKMIENRTSLPEKNRSMGAGFEPVQRSGNLVVECKKLEAGYPDLKLIDGLDWTVRRGERWGVIGDNGAGKSTLIKTVFGRIDKLGGEAKIGTQIDLGCFWQDVVDLDQTLTPIEHIQRATDLESGPARGLLAKFLFEGDDVFKRIRQLSGGEKNKLVLAELTFFNPNVLVLDEPTNHLDIDSRRVLAEVLNEYKGTLILVSHDRKLLSSVTDHILDVKRSGVVQYPGSYDDYRRKTAVNAAPETAKTSKASVEISPRELSKLIAKVEAEIKNLEEQISATENNISESESKLASAGPDDDLITMTKTHGAEEEKLAQLLADWEQAGDRLEVLKAQQGS